MDFFDEKEGRSEASGQSDMLVQYEEALTRYCLINRLNEAMSLIESLPDLCVDLVNIVIEFTSAENCSVMLNDPAAGGLNIVVAKGRNDHGSFYGLNGMSTTVFAHGEGAAGWAFENSQLLSIGDCSKDSRFVERKTCGKTINSVICAPITAAGAPLGIINCSHPKKQVFTEADERTISFVAGQAGLLLQKALYIEALKKEQTDLRRRQAQETEQAEELRGQLETTREQLYKSEKFSTLGELLAGVAHELNNRIAPILIYSQMLKEKAADKKDEKRLCIIEESAMGAKAILETLLNYSRTGPAERVPVNLNQTLQNTLTLAEYKLRNHGVETMLDLCPHLPPVVVNEKQIAQVFLNIINNALSAMEAEGGQLRVSSSYNKGLIKFTISDTGVGVPEEIAEKIFDPFFTTKETGKGTGLGLSISRRYLEDHEGRLYLEPSSGPGATFVLEIPAADIAEEKEEGLSALQFDTETQPCARILVVEDDSAIQDVIRDVLGPRYEIQFASDGREATSKIEDGLFDLLVVDYHMPGLDGKQLYEWISRHRPALKRRVVFSTGDIFHDDIRNFIRGTGCHSLTKPFSTTDLREMISGALSA